MNSGMFPVFSGPAARRNQCAMFVVAVVLLLFWHIDLAQAKPSDRKQPLYVEAGQCVFDVKKNQSHCQQGMQLRQGSLHIDADSGTVFRQGKRIVRIELHGAPAVFRQVINSEDGPFVAKARYMDYRVVDELLLLRGQVVLKNPNMGTFSGEEMTINLKNQEITGGGRNGDNRVHMVMEGEAFSEPVAQPAPENDKESSNKVDNKPAEHAVDSGHD